MTRIIRIITGIVLACCLLYLLVYGLGAFRAEEQSTEMAEIVDRLRSQTPAQKHSPSDAFPTPGTAEDTEQSAGCPAVRTRSAVRLSRALPVTSIKNALLSGVALSSAASEGSVLSPADSGAPLRDGSEPAAVLPSPDARDAVSDTLAENETVDPLLAYYASLHAENPDMIGWVCIPDTKLNYPVMYTPESNQFYLHRNFEKKYAFEGLPFMDYRCDPDLPSDNLVIYGHNMRTGSQFGTLRNYRKQAYLDEHPIVYYDTLNHRGYYRVFAVIPIRLGSLDAERMLCYSFYLTEDEAQTEMLRAYLEKYALLTVPEYFPKEGDELVTLSTCTGLANVNRLVVMALRITPEEAAEIEAKLSAGQEAAPAE